MAFVIDSQKQYVISGKVMMTLHKINRILQEEHIDEKNLYFYLGMLFDLTLEDRVHNIPQLPDEQRFKIN